ncbi:MAG TPA: SirB2 family protein [Accumulibacter sp.]|jgi:uncharacterized membrane protein SirB2|nr:SirB2 family protein [Accumulibacter sp.]HQC80293.1 SirB2 family protein [Accumulibacter sp.]
MTYPLLKHLHVGCAILTSVGFCLRGLWMLTDSPRRRHPAVRILPHIVDTVLLASAVAMALLSGQYPLTADWLTAKVIALLLYIGLGTMALKRGRDKTQRLAFFIGALLCLAYIVSVALSRSALGFLAWAV